MATDKELRRVLRQATKPRIVSWFGKKMNGLFKKLGVDKAGGFIKEKTVDKIKEKINSRQKGTKADLSTKAMAAPTVGVDV
jgi:hypothetical protein